MKNAIQIEKGEIGEGYPWSIEFDSETYDGSALCKHCTPLVAEARTSAYGVEYKIYRGTCPRVVVARNEGGCNSTAICLDCILEAAAKVSDQ